MALALVGMLAVVLSAALAFWHRRHAAEMPAPIVSSEPGTAEAAPPPFSFPCTHCGKKLRARAELSGKQVKCPECGKAVHVMTGPV